MKFSVPATLVLAIALNSCNNAADTKKQVDEQNAKIQSLVDTKMGELQDAVSQECAATVDSLANVQYAAFLEEAKKTGKKVVTKVKHTANAEVKKEEPKKLDTKASKMGGNPSTTNTAADKASKMGGNTNTTNTPSNKASKMGGTSPK